MNKILYITHRDGKLFLGFATALDAEQFLESQSYSHDWQAAWKLERISAYGKFHYSLSIDGDISLNFQTT